MDLNRYMHPRHLYKDNPPDFAELAEKYPAFKPFVKTTKKGKAYVNFRNPAVVRELTKCLLHKDFGLVADLPTNRLTPTIPLRLNYILWMEDLLKATNITEETTSERLIVDIGTGSLCIYPLLGVTTNPNWKFIATEIDSANYAHAVANVAANGLSSHIDVIKVEAGDPMLAQVFSKTKFKHCEKIHSCMCNPPFFTDMNESSDKIGPVANSSCSADSVEMITEGGDFAFASKMLKESLLLKENIIWYTIMLGKKSSFVAIKKRLSEHTDVFVTSYEFCQGRTMRWGIAWTYCVGDITKANLPKSQLKDGAKISKLKKPITFVAKNLKTVCVAYDTLANSFSSLGITANVAFRSEQKIHLKATAKNCTWVHIRKKSRKRKLETHDSPTQLRQKSAFEHSESCTADDVAVSYTKKDGDLNGSIMTTLQVNAVSGHACGMYETPASSAKNGSDSWDGNVLECDVIISVSRPSKILFEFKTDHPDQKETLNGLAVYLRRSVFLSVH